MTTKSTTEDFHTYIAARLAALGADYDSPYEPQQIAGMFVACTATFFFDLSLNKVENLVFYLQHKYGPIPNPTFISFLVVSQNDDKGDRIGTQMSVALQFVVEGKTEVPIKVTAAVHENIVQKLRKHIRELVTPLLSEKADA